MADLVRARRVEELFHAVADLPRQEGAAFLAGACGDDRALYHEVLALLAALAVADDETFLERPAYPGASVPPVPPLEQLGPYRIVGLLGQGGMGAVYEAEQANPRRTVALKVIRPGFLGPAVLKRFEHEAWVLGQLRHPGIGQIYEAGAVDTPLGRQPYFAMELVRGAPLPEYARHRNLGHKARLELFALVCDAVQHAHQKGVIHRDLKPGNILVEESGQPKILDFGVARVTDADVQAITMHTDIGQLVGTVPYMSPEQVAGDAANLDGRSDVYALGVVLYELLTGRLPYDVRNCPIPEAARIIRDEEPSRLSSVSPAYRGDIETIVQKALEKDRERRYASATELAADIRRYLSDEPIVARPASALYQLRKFAKRHTVLVGGIAATLSALLLGLVGMAVLAAREADLRRLADQREVQSRRVAYRASLTAAQAALGNYDLTLARHALQTAPETLRGWEWRHFAYLLDRSRSTWPLLGDVKLVPTRGGDGVLVTHPDGRIERRDPVTGAVQRTWQHALPDVTAIGDSADGLRVLLGGKGGLAVIGPGPTELRWHIGRPAGAGTTSFSPDGRCVAAAFRDTDRASVLDADTGQVVRELPFRDSRPTQAVFAPDGHMVIASFDLVSVAYAWPSGAELWRREGWGPVFLDDDTLAFWMGWNGPVEVLAAHTGQTLAHATGMAGHLRSYGACGPQTLVLQEASGALVLWDWRSQTAQATLLDLATRTNQLVALRGYILTQAAADTAPRVWDTCVEDAPFVVSGLRPHEAMAVSADARLTAGADWGRVAVYDSETGRLLHGTMVSRTAIRDLAFSHDGRRLAVLALNGGLTCVNSATGAPFGLAQTVAGAMCVAWHPDGTSVAVGCADGRVQSLSFAAGDVAAAPAVNVALPAGDPVRGVCFTPDGRALAVVREVPPEAGRSPMATGSVELWHVQDGRRAWQAAAPSVLTCVQCASDGGVVLAGGADGTVQSWEIPTGAPGPRLRGSVAEVRGIACAPDGRRVAAAATDGNVHVWSDEDPEELLALRCDPVWVGAVAFSPDGTRLVASGRSHAVVALETARSSASADRVLNIQALAVVEALFQAHDGREQVLAAAAARHDLEPDVRARALELAAVWSSQANALNSKAWGAVLESDPQPGTFARALQQVRAALAVWPDDYSFLNTLAAVQYRNAAYDDALATLDRCDALQRAQRGDVNPVDLLLRALVHARLGDAATARAERDAAVSRHTAHRLPPEDEESVTMRQFRLELEALLSPADTPGSGS